MTSNHQPACELSAQKPRRQCAKCPWKESTDPYDIPDGYSRDLHKALDRTIAEPASLAPGNRSLPMMACHETTRGSELPCVGWLANQLGPGNNLALRMRAMTDRSLTNFELVGAQHEGFEDTIPPVGARTGGRRRTERRRR